MYITKEIAKEFYINAIAYKVLLGIVYIDEELDFEWTKEVLTDLVSITEEVKANLNHFEQFDENLFLQQLQLLCDEVSKEPDVVRMVGKCPYKQDWVLKLVELVEDIVNEENL